MNIEEKIKSVIDELKPFLNNDGGDIEYVKFEDGIVYVRLLGACAGCSLIDITLKDAVEDALVSEIPEVKSVVRIDSEEN